MVHNGVFVIKFLLPESAEALLSDSYVFY